MTNDLKQVIRQHLEQSYLEEMVARGTKLTPEAADDLLSTLRARGKIDQDADQMLGDFLEKAMKDRQKAQRNPKIFVAFLNLLSSAGIAYFMSIPQWVGVAMFWLLAFGTQIYTVFYMDQ